MAYLRDRDAPCPSCGYNLRQLDSARCPECGVPLRLTVAAAEPPLKPWIALTAALCVAAGPGLFFLADAARLGRLPWRFFRLRYVAVWYFMAAVPLAAVALLARRRFMRLAEPTQRRIAAAAVALSVVAFLVYIARILL